MLQQLRASLAAPREVLPVLRGNPYALGHALRTARRPILALALAFLLCGFAAPVLNRALARQLLPDQSLVERVGSILGGEDRDARRDALTGRLNLLAGLLAGSIVLALFWADLPAGLSRAGLQARRQADLAAKLESRSARESLLLCERALRLATDPDLVVELSDRVAALRARVSPDADPDLVGGRYQILETLSHGGYGVVYRARDTSLERTVALKELALTVTREDDRSRFRQEARALARLSHPHVVQVYDLVDHGGRMWIAMELVEGGDLARHIEREGRLLPAEATRLADMIAAALAFAHDQGIIHRDLKAMNVLLTDDGSVKVADFGTAKIESSSLQTVEGNIMGSPHCMSPEQIRGETLDERSDVYALGVVLYQMLLGRAPFTGEMMAVLSQHLHQEPPPVDTQPDSPPMPPALATLVMRMLSKRPDDRPADMHAVRAALATIEVDVAQTVV